VEGLPRQTREPGELEGWKHLFENGVGFITGGISGVIERLARLLATIPPTVWIHRNAPEGGYNCRQNI
jgi:hypothetical protein